MLLIMVVQVVRIKFFVSFTFVVDFTTVYYIGLLQCLLTIYDLYFLFYQFLLMVGPKVRFLRKILIIFLINEMHRTNIIDILILLASSALYHGLRIIVRVILLLYINSTSIIIVSSKM